MLGIRPRSSIDSGCKTVFKLFQDKSGKLGDFCHCWSSSLPVIDRLLAYGSESSTRRTELAADIRHFSSKMPRGIGCVSSSVIRACLLSPVSFVELQFSTPPIAMERRRFAYDGWGNVQSLGGAARSF